MRYPTQNSIPGWFVGDLPDGGVLIECAECRTTVKSYEVSTDKPLYCLNCSEELHYEKHWSW